MNLKSRKATIHSTKKISENQFWKRKCQPDELEINLDGCEVG